MIKILESVKNRKYIKLFPKKLDKIWFAQNAYTKDKRKRTYLVLYWDENGKYINYDIGDIVPMLRKKGMVAYYKIIGWGRYTSWGSDTAGWDDVREYNLRFYKLNI